MEMEQLLSMGFPSELAAKALAATGGNSTLKATNWILSHPKSPSPSPSSDIHATTTTTGDSFPSQPKLDRFFRPQSKPSISGSPSVLSQTFAADNQDADTTPSYKRPKLVLPTSPTTTPLSLPTKDSKSLGPLSERMRPVTIYDVVGQDHLLSPNSLLRSAIDCNRFPSIVFWGPPGTGKTSIARSILRSSKHPFLYRFVSLSAITCGVKDVRDAVEDARKLRLKTNKATILFVDEVHRFSKSQQDSFLPVIDDCSIVFMGATTENPSFHLITPLLSRCRVLVLNPLKPHHVESLLKRGINDLDKGLTKSVGMRVDVNEDVIQFLAGNCDGDARIALNALEVSATTAASRALENHRTDGTLNLENEENGSASLVATATLGDAKEALQCKHLSYDKAGEEHYNLISALHKSMRGSDADAAIYWLVRMLEGGEQPLYIARRLIRFASEDVGLADPLALNQAVACYQACHFLGMPECNVILAQCVAYLALAPKSVAVYRAIEAAQKVVRESIGQNEGVPLHLRNASTKLMEDLGYGKGYIYPPDNPSLSSQSYLPPSLQGYKFLDWPCINPHHHQEAS